MPQRPRQHVLAAESRLAFEAALPPEWVARRVDGSDDYGIDYEVEIFENGRTTGVLFKVQLKSTDDDRASARSEWVNFQTFDYWQSLDVPVMLAHYSSASGDIRYRWIQAHDPYDDRQASRVGTSIQVHDAAQLTPDLADQVIAEVSFARALKRGERMPLPLPIRLQVATSAPGRAGLIRNAVALLVRTELIGVVVFAAPGSTAFEIVASDNGLVISGPAGLQSLTIDIPAELREQIVPDVIAADCVAALGILLCHVSNYDAGRRLLLSSARRASIVAHPGVAQTVAQCVITTASPGLALAVCERMVALVGMMLFQDFDVASQLLMAAFTTVQSSASHEEYDRAIEVWARIGDLHGRAGDDDGAARSAYNIAQALAGKGDFAMALVVLQSEGLTFDGYPDRAYFHEDVARLCWELGRRWAAVLAYEHAVAIDERHNRHSRSRVLLADALVRLGRLDEAEVALAGWTTDDDAHLNRLAETLRLVIDGIRAVVATPHPVAGSAPLPDGTNADVEDLTAEQVAERMAEPGAFLDIALWERLAAIERTDVGPAAVLAWLIHSSGSHWARLAVLLHTRTGQESQVDSAIDSGLELDPDAFFATLDLLEPIDPNAHAGIMAVVTARSERPDLRPAPTTMRFNGRDLRAEVQD